MRCVKKLSKQNKKATFVSFEIFRGGESGVAGLTLVGPFLQVDGPQVKPQKAEPAEDLQTDVASGLRNPDRIFQTLQLTFGDHGSYFQKVLSQQELAGRLEITKAAREALLDEDFFSRTWLKNRSDH